MENKLNFFYITNDKLNGAILLGLKTKHYHNQVGNGNNILKQGWIKVWFQFKKRKIFSLSQLNTYIHAIDTSDELIKNIFLDLAKNNPVLNQTTFN